MAIPLPDAAPRPEPPSDTALSEADSDARSATDSQPSALSRGPGEVGEPSMSPIDFVAIAIVTIGFLRGLSLGLLREALSIATLGAAVIAVRVWNQPFAHWLQHPSGPSVRHDLAPWVAGALVAIAVMLAVATFARVMRQGARFVARGFVDRIGAPRSRRRGYDRGRRAAIRDQHGARPHPFAARHVALVGAARTRRADHRPARAAHHSRRRGAPASD
jgi:hypothetical protein